METVEGYNTRIRFENRSTPKAHQTGVMCPVCLDESTPVAVELVWAAVPPAKNAGLYAATCPRCGKDQSLET